MLTETGSSHSLELNDMKYGIIGGVKTYTSLPQDADPLINLNHAIHWVLSQEAYSSQPRIEIDGWELLPELSASDRLVYFQGNVGIFAYRGSVDSKDAVNDIQIAKGIAPTKSRIELLHVQWCLQEYPNLVIQTTGHSLGGTVARIVGLALNLPCVTFNAGAPPTAPVINGSNEIDYHIVFDVISAWQNPRTIRIDKGYRPRKIPRFIGIGVSYFFAASVAKPFLEAHAISNFGNKKRGIIVSGEYENNIFQMWYKGLPRIFKTLFLKFIDVNGLGNLKNLPEIQG